MPKHNLSDIQDEYYREPEPETIQCPACGTEDIKAQKPEGYSILSYEWKCLNPECGITFIV